ncbi:hypothetical protein J7K18_00875 [bacterium]|nr:hypothetical protein [bacterium]
MKQLLICAVIVLVAASVAFAGNTSGKLGIGGGIPSGDVWVLSYGLPASPMVIEGIFGFSHGSTTFEFGEMSFSADETKVSFGGGVRYNFREYKTLSLYGGGRLTLDIHSNGDTKVGVGMGGFLGAEYFLTSYFSISLEDGIGISIIEDTNSFGTDVGMRASLYF